MDCVVAANTRLLTLQWIFCLNPSICPPLEIPALLFETPLPFRISTDLLGGGGWIFSDTAAHLTFHYTLLRVTRPEISCHESTWWKLSVHQGRQINAYPGNWQCEEIPGSCLKVEGWALLAGIDWYINGRTAWLISTSQIYVLYQVITSPLCPFKRIGILPIYETKAHCIDN